MGYEDDDLKPYIEPPKDVRDERRILKLQAFGYNLQQVHEALDKERFEEIHATYLLLKEKKINAEIEAAAAAAAATAAITANTSNSGLGTSTTNDSTKTTQSGLQSLKSSVTNDAGQVFMNFFKLKKFFF